MNNDRFKFRVWDKETKKYLLEEEIFTALSLDLSLKECGEISKIISFKPLDRFIIEQSTGLRDKNGALIFENDKCKSVSITSIVEYLYGLWLFNGIILTDELEGDSLGYLSSALEVIGNIHEES